MTGRSTTSAFQTPAWREKPDAEAGDGENRLVERRDGAGSLRQSEQMRMRRPASGRKRFTDGTRGQGECRHSAAKRRQYYVQGRHVQAAISSFPAMRSWPPPHRAASSRNAFGTIRNVADAWLRATSVT
jgi:hypothetical protein